jgi:hypothetical protein
MKLEESGNARKEGGFMGLISCMCLFDHLTPIPMFYTAFKWRRRRGGRVAGKAIKAEGENDRDTKKSVLFRLNFK